MMRYHTLRSVAFRCIITAFIAVLRSNVCCGQFTHHDDPALRPAYISPLGPLLHGLSNVVWSANDFNSANQRIDAAGNLRGNLLQYLRYPQLRAAGYSSFSVIFVTRRHVRLEEGTAQFQTIIDRTNHEAGMDKNRVRYSFRYDRLGWLRAIITTSLEPESEGYSETADSLFYSFSEGGSAQIRWEQHVLSTGSGYASTALCPTLRSFHRITKRAQTILLLDSFQNIRSIESHSWEAWDTCHAATAQSSKRIMDYDGKGRLVRLRDSSSEYTSATSEQTLGYEEMPFDAFESTVKTRYNFAAFREPLIRHWLSDLGPLRVIVRHRITQNFLQYDFKQRGNVLKPDSPQTGVDTAFCVVDRRGERVAYGQTQAIMREPIAFYIHAVEDGEPVVRVQIIPAPPDPAAASSVVCYPLALTSSYTHKESKRAMEADTLILYYTDENLNDYGNYQSIGSKLQFSPTLPEKISYRIRTASLTDARGLTKYLWLDDAIYKLSYH